MHELSLACALLDEVGRDAKTRGLSRVTSIRLVVGRGAHVLPQALESSFELIKAGTIMADAQLLIEMRSPEFYCRRCGLRECRDTFWANCTTCGSPAELTAGAELEIREYEGEGPHGGQSG